MGAQPLIFPQPPFNSPMMDQSGYLTEAWSKWFQILYLRVGGAASAPIPNLNAIPLTNLISQVAPIITAAMYTAPIGQKAVINSFKVQNLDNVARTISIWLVPQGNLPSAVNLAVSSLSIPANSTTTIAALQYQVIMGGGTIQVQSSAPGVLNVIADGRLSA